MQLTVEEIAKKTKPVFEKYGVRRARLFGSFARGEARPDSDIDLLLDVDPRMGLFAYMDLQEQLKQELGRDVDVVAEGSVNKFLRPYIVPELQPLYEEKR